MHFFTFLFYPFSSWMCGVARILRTSDSVVDWTLWYSQKSRVQFPISSLDSSADLNVSTALWPWGQLGLSRKWVPGIFFGVKSGWLAQVWQPDCDLWVDCLEYVGASTSYSLMDLHDLLHIYEQIITIVPLLAVKYWTPTVPLTDSKQKCLFIWVFLREKHVSNKFYRRKWNIFRNKYSARLWFVKPSRYAIRG
jgi:hypothetical protein